MATAKWHAMKANNGLLSNTAEGMDSSDQLLGIHDLSVDFVTDEGIVQAVRGVNLQVSRSSTTGLVGESGSGKSVTALSVIRLLSKSASRVRSGQIWFHHPTRGEMDLLSLTEKQMQGIRGRHISMVFQEPMSSLNPVKRCGWQVTEGMIHHLGLGRTEARRRALSLFEEVRLPDPERVFRSWPHELSGGQRQRIMIAMAMACEPSLLIADEPTTALDVTVQKGILELMRQIRTDRGLGILFISHDLGVIADIADQVSVMLDGRVVESAATASILQDPGHPYTKALIACRPGLDGKPDRLPTVDDFMGRETPQPAANDRSRLNKAATCSEGQASAPRGRNLQRGADPGVSRQQPAILEIRGLQTSFVTATSFFGRRKATWHAVNLVDFDVYKGETLGLVGESGCGKTTLGRTLMRLVEPAAGRMVYKGVDLTTLRGRELRKLRPRFQIIFQDPYASLTPGLMVGRAIMEPMRVHGILGSDRERKERVMQLLQKVNLEETHFYRYPHEFSGGQRQRICIARALALSPEFVICDEAVSALDVSVQAQVLNLLNDLKEEFGLTYIFISHDLSVVRYMSDRVMVMKEGKLVEVADAETIYRSPVNAYTKKLLDAIPGIISQRASHR